MLRWFLLIVCLLGLAAPAAAQTVTDERVWMSLTLQGPVSEGSAWRWSLDGYARSRDGVETLDVTAIRATIAYTINSRVSVGGGYGIAPSFPASGGTTIERRGFGQVVFTVSAAGGSMTFRSRLENRMIEGNSGPLVRFREQVRFSRPIKKGSKTAFVTYDELLLHLNTTTRSPRGVDQNRYFVGISHAMTTVARFEVGYLNQFSPGHNGAANRMNHVLSGGLVFSF